MMSFTATSLDCWAACTALLASKAAIPLSVIEGTISPAAALRTAGVLRRAGRLTGAAGLLTGVSTCATTAGTTSATVLSDVFSTGLGDCFSSIVLSFLRWKGPRQQVSGESVIMLPHHAQGNRFA